MRERLVDLFLHALLPLRHPRSSAESSSAPQRQQSSSHVDFSLQHRAPPRITWLSTSIPRSRKQKLGQRSDRHASGRLARGRTLQHVARFGKVVLQRSGKIRVSRPRRRHPLVLARIARLPPAATPSSSSSRGFRSARRSASRWLRRAARPTECAALSVSIFMRPPRPIALLPPPQFAVDEFLAHFADRQAGRKGKPPAPPRGILLL